MENSKLIFRIADSRDIALLRDFESRLVAYEQPIESTLQDGPLQYYHLELLLADRENTQILIAHLDGKPVGCGLGQIRNNEPIYRERQ